MDAPATTQQAAAAAAAAAAAGPIPFVRLQSERPPERPEGCDKAADKARLPAGRLHAEEPDSTFNR